MKKIIFTFICCFLASNIFAQNDAKWQKIADTQQTADNLVENRKIDWGLNEKDALVRSEIMPKTDKLGFKHFRYQQTHNGVKVEGAVWLVHEKDGSAKMANGNLVKNLNVEITASLNEEQALQYALNSVNAEIWAWEDDNFSAMAENEAGFYPQGELVLVSPDMERGNPSADSYFLAYKFDIFAVSPLSRNYIYVNAQNGDIVTSQNRMSCNDVAATGTASYSCNNPVSIIANDNNGFYELKENGRGNGITTYTAENTNSYLPLIVVSTDNHFDDDPVATAAHYGTEQFYDYLLNEHGRNSIDDAGFTLKSWVHYGNGYNNAFWNGSFMTYGDGNGSYFTPLTCLDITGHEITHGLTEYTANLIYSYESGALNEAFSDIFGTLLEFYTEPDCADWIIGEDITVVTGKNGLRNMENPNDASMLRRQPDTYLGDYWYAGSGDHGGVHYNSGVLNYWFYLIANGGNGTNDNGDAYNVVALDTDMNEARAKAADIAFRTLTVYLFPTAQYVDAKNVSIQAATDLYGANSSEVQSVKDAWCAVGVGDCLQNDNSLTVSNPNGGETWQSGSNKVVNWASTGNIAQINIELSINGGGSWQNIVTATNNDGSYGFAVPNMATTQALIKISDSNDATVYDVSDAVFTIETCDVTSGFESSANETCVPQSLDFTNTAVNATAYEWYVNGTLESNAINFNYTFSAAGTYLVSLVATNGLNCTDEYNETITVYPTTDANFTYTTTSLEIQLFATNENATTYEWTADNVSIGNTATLNHIFAEEGTYNVCLTIIDDCGMDTFCENIVANVPNPCEGSDEAWRQYLNGDDIQALLEVGDNIFVGTEGGGLVKINQVTNETTFFTNFNSDLPHNNIYSLLESSSGDIFVGTSGGGLAKFDGNSSTGWTIFNTSNSDLPSNLIYSLLESSSGAIFVATYGGGLAKFDGNSSTSWTIFNTSNSDLPSNYIHSLLESSSGAIFVGTGDGLAKFDGNSSTGWTIFNTSNSDLPHNYIRSLLENSSGAIFVGAYGGGLAKFDGNSSTGWTIFNTSNSDLRSNTVQSLLENSSGAIFVGAYGGGLAKFDGTSSTGWTIFNTENSDLPANVCSLLESSSGEIFVGTWNGGLAKFDGVSNTGWTILNTSNSDLPRKRVKSLLESSNGDIFVGTGDGLAKFDGVSNTGWTIFNTSNSDLPNNAVYSLLENNNGEIFIGTSGGLAKFDGTSSIGWTIFNTENSDLPSNFVHTLLEDNNGNIFVGTIDNLFADTNGGLVKFDGTSSTGWIIFNTENSDLPDNDVWSLLQSSSGNIFIGTNGGGLAKFDGNSSTGWTIFNTENSDLPHNNVYTLLEDNNENIFIGGSVSKLAKFDGTSSTGWTIFNTSGSVFSLLKNDNNDIFVGTSGGGLAKFDGTSSTGWTSYNTENSSLLNNAIYSLLESNNGDIFVGTRRGLSVLSNNPNITASFTHMTPSCTNETATFTNTSTGATNYEWEINGILTSTETDLTHTFTQAGEYTITLKATDINGCEDTHSETITINNNALDLDLGEDILECDVASIVLDAGFDDMSLYSWGLNNVTIGSTQSVTATESGTYLLTVLDQCGNAHFDEIEVEIGSECVWPGDTNYDNVVNPWDILPLGFGYGTVGTARPNASLNWEGQPCSDWPEEQVNGVNFKHIDTNGDGVIDANDGQAIITNANQTHGIPPSFAGSNNSPVSIVPTLMGPATLTSSNLMVIDLNLSEDDTQELTAYGLAFRLTYYLPPNVASLQDAFINFNGSWLGEENELLTVWKHFPEDNIIEIGMTRFNLQNKIGQGKVAQLILEVDIDDVTTIDQMDVYLEVEGVQLQLNNTTIIPVGASNATVTLYNETCDAPTNLQETGLTCTDVTLSWDAMPDAEAYQLRGRKVGRPLKIFPEMQDTFRIFTGGLQTNKTYEWGVRTKCDGVWTAYTPFNTFSTPTCKNSTYDETKDPFFVSETESFFSEISLFPNPVKDNLNISFTSFEKENINVKVIDIVGKTVLAKKIESLQGKNNFTLNIEILPSGTYFLEMENGFENTVQKFIVW